MNGPFRVFESAMLSMVAVCAVLAILDYSAPGTDQGASVGFGAGIGIAVTLAVDMFVRHVRKQSK